MSLMRPISEVQNQMERMFSDMMQGFGLPYEEFSRPFGVTQAGLQRAWIPPIEKYESDNEYVIRLQVPGLNPEDIDVEVSGNVVQISGEHREERQRIQGANLRHSEFLYGRFMRRVPLNGDVQSEQARADFQNGILELHLPKSEESKRRKIQVGSRGEQQSQPQRQR